MIGAASAHLRPAPHRSATLSAPSVALPATGDAAIDALVRSPPPRCRDDRGDDPDQVFVGGASQVRPAFDAVETVREVLGILEQQYVVVTLLRDVLDRGLQVAIGTETGMAPLAECALVVAPYEVDGEPAGTIGVLGPDPHELPAGAGRRGRGEPAPRRSRLTEG